MENKFKSCNLNQFKEVFFCFFVFAGFADLPAAKVCQFADCCGKGNYRQNAMYSSSPIHASKIGKEMPCQPARADRAKKRYASPP